MPLCTRHHFALIIENSCLIWKFDDTCKLVFTLPDLSINCCILSQTTVAKTKEYTLYQISVHCIQVLSLLSNLYKNYKRSFFFHDFINKWNMEFIYTFVCKITAYFPMFDLFLLVLKFKQFKFVKIFQVLILLYYTYI